MSDLLDWLCLHPFAVLLCLAVALLLLLLRRHSVLEAEARNARADAFAARQASYTAADDRQCAEFWRGVRCHLNQEFRDCPDHPERGHLMRIRVDGPIIVYPQADGNWVFVPEGDYEGVNPWKEDE